MTAVSKTEPTTLRIPEAIKTPAMEFCAANNISLSVALQRGLLLLMNRPDLAEHVSSMGRPRVEQPKRARRKKASD